MKLNKLHESAKGLGGRLIIVSNREPFIHRKTETGLKIERPAGGLTSAMDDVLRAIGGKWVAWGSGSGDKEAGERVMVPPEDPSYTLKRVWLTPREVNNYYHGFSNQVLWPLCHMTLDRVYFLKKFWDDYLKVNAAFAESVIEEIRGAATVWVHDYHLCLVPGMLRERSSKITIAHFWHIPWPDWSVFRVCPKAREILEGMLNNDLIGFQISLFVKNFLDCVREGIPEAVVDYRKSIINYKGRTIRLKAFPISIDFNRFDSIASTKKTVRSVRHFRAKYGLANYTGIGVDRLEYTKGLIKRLQALDLFFERHEQFRGKFVFVQVAVPTRMREPYLSYKKAVEELVKKINDKYSVEGWAPVVYTDSKLDQEELAALYRLADVAIVSSVYDGMNLVAKEYIASQVDEKGVLILSELTGAADELEEALQVNPYDIENFAESINAAIVMPEEERRARMSMLRAQVKSNDIHKWIGDILTEMASINSTKKKAGSCLYANFDRFMERILNNEIYLFLDYDGTLTPIAKTPAEAVLPQDMRLFIKRLVTAFPLAVVTGRTLADIMERIGIKDMVYAGNHGSEIWDGKKTVISRDNFPGVKPLREFLDKIRPRIEGINGVLIEDKGITASIHYRLVDVEYLPRLSNEIDSVLKDYRDAFKVNTGKKVFEISPKDAWNKGDAVKWILENLGQGRFPVYIGDDTTDEDAYRAIRGKGISISVGLSTESDFFLEGQHEVKGFLEEFMRLKEGVAR